MYLNKSGIKVVFCKQCCCDFYLVDLSSHWAVYIDMSDKSFIM